MIRLLGQNTYGFGFTDEIARPPQYLNPDQVRVSPSSLEARSYDWDSFRGTFIWPAKSTQVWSTTDTAGPRSIHLLSHPFTVLNPPRGGAELIASKSPMTESLIEIQSIPKLKRSISVF